MIGYNDPDEMPKGTSSGSYGSEQIYNNTAEKGKSHHKKNVAGEPLPSHGDLQCSQIGDLGSRSRDHKGRGRAQAHAFRKPALQKGDGAASAGIEGYADGGSHENAPGPASSEDLCYDTFRHISLEKSGKQDAGQKIPAGSPDVAAEI